MKLAFELLAALLAANSPDAGILTDGGSARSFETVVSTTTEGDSLPPGRATSSVNRGDLDRRLPRSAPDALRYEPGVFVQQTAHGQGSAFIRGLTGQQTLLLFDGIRLNNSTYRQGPNQYFFTLDSRTIERIDVLRGGASTQLGSDALGGAIATYPLEPSFDPPRALRPSLSAKGATSDSERGGRVQLDAQVGRVALLAGVGGRRVGLLQSAGPVRSPLDGSVPDVPRFLSDDRTQLGTGYDELTADGRLVLDLADSRRLTLATYAYRQYGAPRTDQCPPPGARFDECLVYDEQFRTLAYLAYDAGWGIWGEHARATVSYQAQHERRNSRRPASFVSSLGRDDVDTFGVTARATTRAFDLGGRRELQLTYGADTYFDLVRSRAYLSFLDTQLTLERTRGQYLDGSSYLYGGAFVDGELKPFRQWTFRAGARSSWMAAHAPGDSESGSTPIDRAWFPLVGHVGAEWTAGRWTLLAHLDRSFRAPNLDDLTSRQQTGPGFQFENPELKPEAADTAEIGAQLRSTLLTAELWLFRTVLSNAVSKVSREVSECPRSTPQCQTSWYRYQLANATSASNLFGAEGWAKVRLPYFLSARLGIAWAVGEGPNLAEPPSDPAISYEARVPLTRVPPLNGTADVQWLHPSGLGAGAGVRWAAKQDRLAVADRSDARIPPGGTPGFAVVDLRASYRRADSLTLALVLENVFDTPYRYHGSSVNGPGRGIIASIEFAPF
ncbi:MAG: TonB-dependent receptor [Myxococcota bacterium]